MRGKCAERRRSAYAVAFNPWVKSPLRHLELKTAAFKSTEELKTLFLMKTKFFLRFASRRRQTIHVSAKPNAKAFGFAKSGNEAFSYGRRSQTAVG